LVQTWYKLLTKTLDGTTSRLLSGTNFGTNLLVLFRPIKKELNE